MVWSYNRSVSPKFFRTAYLKNAVLKSRRDEEGSPVNVLQSHVLIIFSKKSICGGWEFNFWNGWQHVYCLVNKNYPLDVNLYTYWFPTAFCCKKLLSHSSVFDQIFKKSQKSTASFVIIIDFWPFRWSISDILTCFN